MRRATTTTAAGICALLSTSWTANAGAAGGTTAQTAPTIDLDPVSLIANASGPVFAVVWLLIAASVVVWFIMALKLMQLRRWTKAEEEFELESDQAASADEMYRLAKLHIDAPGARIVAAIEKRADTTDRLPSAARRALVAEEKRASSLMPTLASIGSASPFIGLFGTVYGIMDAFLRIGREKSASLPVVAPAIGEALIATAIGLFAAIPAVIAYNAIAKRIDDLMAGVEASAEDWIAVANMTPDTLRQPRESKVAESQPLPLGQGDAQGAPQQQPEVKPPPIPRQV